MRSLLLGLLAGLCLSGSAAAQFKGYFDVSRVEIPDLKPPAWDHRQDGDRHLYLCVEGCDLPTGIEIKGIIRDNRTFRDSALLDVLGGIQEGDQIIFSLLDADGFRFSVPDARLGDFEMG